MERCIEHDVGPHSPEFGQYFFLEIPTNSFLEKIEASGKTRYTKPEELTAISFDEDRRMSFDKSQLVNSFYIFNNLFIQKIYVPSSDFLDYSDLTHGISSFVQKPDDLNEYLFPLLKAAKHLGISPLEFDLVTWRGVLTKIFSSPFLKESWKMNGNFYRGTLFLAEAKAKLPFTQHHKKLMYGGFKFESLCMLSRSEILNSQTDMKYRQGKIVNTNAEYNGVFRSSLGPHKLLFGAEIDGLDENKTDYIELKTTSTLSHKNINTFQNKILLKWWTQSYIAGVPKIIVGCRNEKQQVEALNELRVNAIPGSVRGKVSWDPQLIISFGNLFISWLKGIFSGVQFEESELYFFELCYDPTVETRIKLELKAEGITLFKDELV